MLGKYIFLLFVFDELFLLTTCLIDFLISVFGYRRMDNEKGGKMF